MKNRYGNDVQKMHTVDNTRGEVLDKLRSQQQAQAACLVQPDGNGSIEAGGTKAPRR